MNAPSLRLGWLTDVHLNFLSPAGRAAFYQRLRGERMDAILLGGDIGEARSVNGLLAEMEAALEIPIYFVLGNHDFYGGSIRAVRERVAEQCAASKRLHWLPAAGTIALTDDTALIGHDSWADGRAGDYDRSDVLLNDYFQIGELTGLTKRERLARMNALGDEAAAFLDREARKALALRRHVLVLTHAPPFRESCWHEGKISDDDWLPHFACLAVGERLAAVMREHPQNTMTVLCGHTHSAGRVQILDNLTVLTGGAVYGAPALQQIFEIA